jgi:hypothetical protein
MQMSRAMAAVVGLTALLLGACGGDSDDVTGSSPTSPSVSGQWEGSWHRPELPAVTRHEVLLSLRQSGSQVSGTLKLGRFYVNDITGTIDGSGVLRFTGRDTDGINGCVTYFSESPHLVLEGHGAGLEGPVVSQACASGSVAYPGVMSLSRVR